MHGVLNSLSHLHSIIMKLKELFRLRMEVESRNFLLSTSNLSVLGVFNIPNLSYNLFFVGQLVELGYCITFDYSGGIVQDPRTGQELGISLRVGRMFPVNNLCLPPVAPVSVAVTATAVSSIPSLAL